MPLRCQHILIPTPSRAHDKKGLLTSLEHKQQRITQAMDTLPTHASPGHADLHESLNGRWRQSP
eukprot:539840-Amphidinium_carterae.2